MGTNFGNIHVISNDKNEVIAALKNVSSGRPQMNANLEIFAGFGSVLKELMKSQNVYYLGELKPGWISVLNDSFDWGEVEAFGEELSSYVPSSILTISYFDDDVFEMNLYRNGEQLTGQIWCSEGARDAYELEDKRADISVLSEHIGYPYINQLTEILSLEDCEQAVDELQKLLGIPLWIKSDWFDDIEDEELISKYERVEL